MQNLVTFSGLMSSVPVVTPPVQSFATPINTTDLRDGTTLDCGCLVKIIGGPVVVTQLGRYKISGQPQTRLHKVRLLDFSGFELAVATVDIPSGTAGQFAYADISPIVLVTNGEYYLMTEEATGGDKFVEQSAVNGNADVNIVAPAYRPTGGLPGTVPGGPNNSYGPVNFKYYRPA